LRLPLLLVRRDVPLAIRLLDIRAYEYAETVWALQHAAYRHEALQIGSAALPPLLDTVQTLQGCGETFFGHFETDGELSGAVSVKQGTDKLVEICRLMVDPMRFRQGIGSKLLQYLFTEALPGHSWEVVTEIRNQPAINLYACHGFLPVGRWQQAPGLTMVRFVRPPG
jgi:GNAT superfamily N-acetyltransferase